MSSPVWRPVGLLDGGCTVGTRLACVAQLLFEQIGRRRRSLPCDGNLGV